MSVATMEPNTVQAELIQRIKSETEVRTRKFDAQQKALGIAEKLKAATLKANQQMTECHDIDHSCDGLLYGIEQAKCELLRTTPEGKRIRILQAEMHDLKFIKGDPQLALLYRKLELAEARGETDVVATIEANLLKLHGKIDALQREIDRLWTGFGFDAESLPKV